MKTPAKIALFILALFALWPLGTTSAATETVEFDGLIEPHEVVDIGAPAAGIVAEVTVDRSSQVARGDVLVALESSVERAALEKAAAMTTFDGELGLQQAKLAFTKRVHKRLKRLKAVSVHDKDQAATEIALTRYRLDKAGENSNLATIELKKAKALLAKRSIRSPISGVVVERYVSPGEYVNSQPLLRVAQINPLRVEVIVPAQMYGKIRPGMPATIIPELPQYGTPIAFVSLVDKVIDPASSTFGVRLELPNNDLQMPSGLKCQVRFEIDAPLNGPKTVKPRIVAGQDKLTIQD